MVSSASYHKPLKPRIVLYDFGQAAILKLNQADGILEIIEAIIETDVDRSIEAFQTMGQNEDCRKLQVRCIAKTTTSSSFKNTTKLFIFSLRYLLLSHINIA